VAQGGEADRALRLECGSSLRGLPACEVAVVAADSPATIDEMSSPIKPLPREVERWIGRLGMLRWGDAVIAWALAWVAIVLTLGEASALVTALLAVAVVAGAGWLTAVRVRWRPLSAVVGIVVSRALRAGARAWYIRPHAADLVLVTARRGLRVVIAGATESRTEGFAVRRTRVLLLPADDL
jgi:hypothetical protein